MADSQVIVNLGTGGSALNARSGSTTGADSNDPKFLDWQGENYVYLPGVAGNYLSVPDEAALDITGDIDIRVQVAMDDWTPATRNTLFAKALAGTQISYRLDVETSGALRFVWSTDGTIAATATSTTSVVASNGLPIWVRVAVDVDPGTAKFYTSNDGSAWSQLGADVSMGGVTSLFSGSANPTIGSRGDGLEPSSGSFYRAQVLDGIDGTPVLDVDTSQVTSGSDTSFTALTGQTVTINRSTSGRKSVAVTHPVWLFGTDDYMEVPAKWVSGAGLYLPGINGNYASTPDSAALDITGDLTLEGFITPISWRPAVESAVLGKWSSSGFSYILTLHPNGNLRLYWSTTGSDTVANISTASVPNDGQVRWVRATLDVDNGAGGYDVRFWTSDDGVSWTQLGSTVTGAGTTSIYSGSAAVSVGAVGLTGTSNVAKWTINRARIYNSDLGSGSGTPVFDADFTDHTTGTTSFTEDSTNAATVTINTSGSSYVATLLGEASYVYPGGVSPVPSTYSLLDFGASDSFTVLAVVRQWDTVASTGRYIQKGASAARYVIYGETGQLSFSTLRDESSVSANTTAITSTAGALRSLAMVIDRTAQTHTQYLNATAGTPVSTSALGSIVNTSPLLVGAVAGGSSYQDFEGVAFAVFRRALTSAEISTITTYFQGRVA